MSFGSSDESLIRSQPLDTWASTENHIKDKQEDIAKSGVHQQTIPGSIIVLEVQRNGSEHCPTKKGGLAI